jgi:hypothetical protein
MEATERELTSTPQQSAEITMVRERVSLSDEELGVRLVRTWENCLTVPRDAGISLHTSVNRFSKRSTGAGGRAADRA